MAENSKIEWTDHTFNPWIGCTKVSPGCAHCYAERDFDLRKHVVKWGAGQPRHRTKTWSQPLAWNRDAHHAEHDARTVGGAAFRRPRVFCASLADWLDHEVPVKWRHDLLDLIDSTPLLDWQLLTKRPQNWRPAMVECAASGSSLAQRWLDGHAPANVWLGTSVEDQTRADERIPMLLSIPARVRFLSCEPLLTPLNLGLGLRANCLAWVICGGESGPGARPMHPAWPRAIEDQCAAAGVAFLFKQWGDWLPAGQEMNRERTAPAAAVHTFEDGAQAFRVGKTSAGRLLDGVEYSAFPAVECGNQETAGTEATA